MADVISALMQSVPELIFNRDPPHLQEIEQQPLGSRLAGVFFCSIFIMFLSFFTTVGCVILEKMMPEGRKRTPQEGDAEQMAEKGVHDLNSKEMKLVSDASDHTLLLRCRMTWCEAIVISSAKFALGQAAPAAVLFQWVAKVPAISYVDQALKAFLVIYYSLYGICSTVLLLGGCSWPREFAVTLSLPWSAKITCLNVPVLSRRHPEAWKGATINGTANLMLRTLFMLACAPENVFVLFGVTRSSVDAGKVAVGIWAMNALVAVASLACCVWCPSLWAFIAAILCGLSAVFTPCQILIRICADLCSCRMQ